MDWKQGFDRFCAALGDLSYLDLIREVERADAEAQRAMAGGRRGAPAARAAGAPELAARAGRLLFWLRHGGLPSGHTSADLGVYRAVAGRLIARGEFRPEALTALGGPP